MNNKSGFVRNGQFICKECNKVYISLQSYNAHRSSHSIKAKQSRKDNYYKNRIGLKKYQDSIYDKYVKDWQNGVITGSQTSSSLLSAYIKRYIHHKYNNKCAQCGFDRQNQFSNKSILEIDHIDGNGCNHVEENLILLCPNCHALTSTYRGLNRGKSTRKR